MTGTENYDDGALGYVPPSFGNAKYSPKVEPLRKEPPKEQGVKRSSAEAAQAAYEHLAEKKREKHDDFGSSDDTIDDCLK